MKERAEAVEQVGPHARIQSELLRVESQKQEVWLLIAFAIAVLVLGVLSLLAPGSFWHFNQLELTFSPQVLFVGMMTILMIMLFVLRRDLEMRRLRLVSLQQTFNSQSNQAASMIDAVTNVFTRSFLHDLLQGEIARAERTNRPLALIMSDLNNFKLVNDRYGHLMGDYVLSQVASVLKTCVRGSDYVVRYGGDEFLILLPETDEKGAEIVRQRIGEKVTEWDRNHRMGEVPISLSLGLYLHVPGQTPEQDVAEVDSRMYIEKQGMKNGATVAIPTAMD
jgi:diguanylate cyclase (GGDEF)-like protein